MGCVGIDGIALQDYFRVVSLKPGTGVLCGPTSVRHRGFLNRSWMKPWLSWSVDVEDRIRSSPSWFISQPVIDIRLAFRSLR